MFSSIQVALLFDLDSFSDICKSEKELQENVARLKLSSLRLLTEFGAQTEKGSEVVRWSYKYYDSSCFKPDTTRKSFQDFDRKSFDDFENDLTDRFYRAFDAKQGDGSAGGKSGAAENDEPNKSAPGTKPHCYILNKSFQEVVHDYNWDTPDISSPVKANRRRTQNKSKLIPENLGPYNAVIVYTNVPKNQNELRKFCGEEGEIEGTADNFMDSILDPATRRAFHDEKKIRPYFINLANLGVTYNHDIFNGIRVGLSKLQGGLFAITSLVQTKPKCIIQNDRNKTEAEAMLELFPLSSQPIVGAAHSIHSEWWSKGRPGRARKPQPGPSLVWEDSQGTYFLQAQLEVLAVQGSSARAWSDAVVVGVIELNAVSLVAVAGGMGSLYVCHAPNTVFTTLVQTLAKYQLAMLLRLGCGGLALLCPWAGDVGCLAVVSSSGLAVPPLPSTSQQSDEILTHFASEIVKRCLGAAPAHNKSEPAPSDKHFDPQKTERWFCPERASVETISKIQKKRTQRIERKVMLERLQKKYRPQIPQPLGSGEISSSSLMAPDKTHTAAGSQVAPGKKLPLGKKLGISRAQMLMLNSRVVTAQQKVKDLKSEEEERNKKSVRRAAQANEQQRKTEALASQTLNAVQDPQDTSQFVTSLIELRDGTENEQDVPDMDLFTTAQTIMNLTLMHVKAAPGTNMESGLRKVLENGVLQTMQKINEIHSGPPGSSKLRQYKIQSLLNLELLWVLGYSSSSKTEDESSEGNNHSESVRDELVEAAIKMLRAIMMHYNPSAMAVFLQETITENYCETLGEVLVEIYEELNQPLPENLAILTGNLMSVAPPSNKSNIGSVQSYDSGAVGSFENHPGSGKEMRRTSTALQRHPSFKDTKRQIVVPIGPRVLRRTVSEVQPKTKLIKQPEKPPGGGKKSKSEVEPKKNKAEDDVRKVRRSLFDMDDVPRKHQRSHTVGAAELRKKSPRKKPKITPKKKLKGSSSSQESFKTPLKDTPNSETGWKTPKSKMGSAERILVPETPHYKIGTNEFNKKRVRKSTGNTIITESPDVKRGCKTTPRRLKASLTINRRTSFYSGASKSRNWEKGKSQFMLDKIRGKNDRKSLDISVIENVGDASFLFSEIFNASQSDISQDLEKVVVPEKKVLNFGLDDNSFEAEKTENVSSEFSGFSSPSKNTRLSSKSSAGTASLTSPRKSIRRSLMMTSPDKQQSPSKGVRIVSLDSSLNNTNLSTSMGSDVFESPSKNTRSSLTTPVKERIESPSKIRNISKLISNEEVILKQSPMKSRQNSLLQNACMLSMTPSKRVQFNFTPSKRGSMGGSPTSKGILKTPGKTPTKSPLKTPKKSPKLTPNKHIRNRISQSPFKSLSKSPLRTILMTTPTKVEFKTPTKSPHSKTPIKSPFRSPNIFFSSTKILRTPIKTPSKNEAIDTDKPKVLLLSKDQFDEFSDLVPETPNKTNENTTKLDTLPLIDREMELSSPVKGSRGRSTASIVLHNTPTKGQHGIQRDLFSLDSFEIPVGSISAILPNPILCQASEQEDADGAANLPDIAPEDIEFVNSIMFGSNFDPDSGLGITGSSDEDEELYKQRLTGMLNSLSSPVKGSGHITQEVVMGFEQEVTLGLAGNCATPVKLDSLLNDYIEGIKTPGKESKLTAAETIDSPEISLDPKIQKYLEKMKGKQIGIYQLSEIEAQNNFVPSTALVSSTNTLVNKPAKRKLLTEDEAEENENVFKDSIENENIKPKKKKRISNENNIHSSEIAIVSKRKSKRMSNETLNTAVTENIQTNEVLLDGSTNKVIKYMEGVTLQASMLYSSEDYEKSIIKDGQQHVLLDSNVNRRGSNDNDRNNVHRISKRLSLEQDNNLSNKKEAIEEDEIFIKRKDPNISTKKKRIFDSDSEVSLSPVKSLDVESMPLKNVENVILNKIEKQENSENSDSITKDLSSSDRRHKQQRIDAYLSPGRKASGIETTPTRGTIDSLSGRKRSVTPLDDWKRVKPLRGMKLTTDKSDVEFDEKLSDSTTMSKTEGSPKKKKKKGVKMKIAKTNEGYKASTNVSLEGSDLNSSKENLNDSSSTENIFTPKSKKKKNKDYEKFSFLTPHRFTRGISKDLHVTPDVFQKLITLSPVKNKDENKSSKRLSDEFLGAKIEEELSRKSNQTSTNYRSKDMSTDLEDLPMPTPPSDKINNSNHNLSDLPMPTPSPDKINTQKSQNSDFDELPMPSPEKVSPIKGLQGDIWTVTSVPGSPTMSKFIRKEKKKNMICKTPRIHMSRAIFDDYKKESSNSSPSIQSILHLASSPIIKTKSEISESSKSKKTRRSRRLSSAEFDKVSDIVSHCVPKQSASAVIKVYKTYEEKILEEVAQLDKTCKTRRKSSTSVDPEVSLKKKKSENTGHPTSPILKSKKQNSRRSTLSKQEAASFLEDFMSPPKSKRFRGNQAEYINEASDNEIEEVLPVTPKSYKTYEDRIMDEVKQLSNTPRSTRPCKNLRDVSSPEDDEVFELTKKTRKSTGGRAPKRRLEKDLPEVVNEEEEFDSAQNDQTFKTPKVEPSENGGPSRPNRNCKTPKGVCYISPVSPEEEYYPRQKGRSGRRLSRVKSILD